MRITLGMLTDRVLTNLTAASERLLEAQDRVSTGKKLHKPSDDVPGIGRSLNLRSVLASLEQLGRNSDMAASWLAATSSALDQVVKGLQNVRNLALTAANSALTEEARSGIVTQLNTISTELASVGNNLHLGRYIFSGNMSSTKPLTQTGGDPPYAYQGDDGRFDIQVAAGIYITVNVTGDKVFNMNGAAVPGASDVFAMIKSLCDKITAGDVQGISNQVAEIDANLNNATNIRSQVGGRLNRLEAIRGVLADSKVKVMDLLSKTEDVDIAEAVLDLRTKENVYQAAIASASRVLQISLADFLK